MASTRSRSLSLSLALHGVLVVGLIWLGSGRTPPADAPAGISVVWVETGLPDLAGPGSGDAGIAETTEQDPEGEPVPIEITAATEGDSPAPELPDARDPVSGADRPAPTPVKLADENTLAKGESETRPEESSEASKTLLEAPSEMQAQAPPETRAETPSETGPGDSSGTRPEDLSETGPTSFPETQAQQPPATLAESSSEMEDLPDPFAETPPAEKPLADVTDAEAVRAPGAPARSAPGTPALASDATVGSAAPAVASAPSPGPAPELAAADEREMLREEVMDLLNRSRELPSRASAAWSHDGNEYRAELTQVLSAGAMGIEEALIEISTERNGRHVSTEMRVKRLAFSHYAQFIDRWDPEVQIHDDEIDGRFHSNTEILIQNSGGIQPVFYGKVTTTSGIDTTRSSRRVRRNEVFLGGLETRVPRIALPRRFAPLEAIAADADHIVALETDSRVTFFADGAYAVEATDGGARRSGQLGAGPTYFVAGEKTAVAVKGTVNGKVLVYSPTEIVIEGDLVYAADPDRVENADDYVGLVSDGTVEIADPEVTGPGDLTVHAAIYAKRRFEVRRYSRGDRATLSIYGSVTAGSLTATEPRYRTKLEFDTRLENARPPSFPMTDRYEVTSWDGLWR